MGMDRWKLTISWVPDDKDADAETYPAPDYWRASLHFNLDNLTTTRKVREAVIHELIHALLGPYSKAAEVFADDKKDILRMLEDQFCTAIEKWPMWLEGNEKAEDWGEG